MKKNDFYYVPSLRILTLILPLLLQTGCAGTQGNQVTDVETRQKIDSITSIAVLEIPEPQQYLFGQGMLG